MIDTIEQNESMIENEIRKAVSAEELELLHPLDESSKEAISHHRQEVADILHGRDSRMIAIVGPCSLDDSLMESGTPSVIKYAELLEEAIMSQKLDEKLKIIMRVNPAKPRTNLGWIGLEQDSIEVAHALMTSVASTGMPLVIEAMNDRHLARYGNLLSMAWVGARNVQDTHLRHSISARSWLPMLFKNDTTGSIETALDAILTASNPHKNVELVARDNTLNLVNSTGNPNLGFFHRGSCARSKEEFIQEIHKIAPKLTDLSVPMLIDCSHGNSQTHNKGYQKDESGQLRALDSVIKLMGQGVQIKGIALESYLVAGNGGNISGRSRTDPCIGIDETINSLNSLASII